MIFLYILLFFIFNLILYLVGRSLIHYLKFNDNLVYINLIYGVFTVGVISFFLNFFTGLDNPFVKLFLLIIILLSLKNLNQKKIKDYGLILILSILIFPTIIYMGPGYDGGLYHLPHQNLIKNEKIIFGIGNIRRFGFGSINEYISALLWYKENLFFLKFIQGTYLVIFFSFIIENIKKLNINIKIIIPLIFSLPFLQRYYTHAYTFTDVATTIFYVLSFIHGFKFFLLKNYSKSYLNKEITTFLILLFLTIAIKPTGSLILFYSLGVFTYIIFKFNFLIKDFFNFIWIYLVFFFWFLKNLISTGCLVYPITFSCLKFLEWSSYKNSIDEYESAKSFARQPYAGSEPLYNWNWLTKYWINAYDKFIISFIFINCIILVILFLYKYFYKKNLYKTINLFTLSIFFLITLFFQENNTTILNSYFVIIKEIILVSKFSIILILTTCFLLIAFLIKLNKNNINLSLIFSVSFIILSLVLWFFNSPVPRFGLFLFFCISILNAFLLCNLNNEITIEDLKIKNTLLICIFYYLLIVSSQSTKTENLYSLNNLSEIYWISIIKDKNFSLPKMGYGKKEEEIIPDIKLIKRTNFGYKPNTSDQCWLKLECYPYKDVKIYKTVFSYKFMKLIN